VADFTKEQREKLASEGKAMPDGGYPIRDEADLKNAIAAIGRASNPAAAKAHIKKRAAALGKADLIPEAWNQDIDYVVAFALDGSGESGVSKPFEVLRVGEYKRGARQVPVTSADLDKAVENFNRWKAMGQEIPVDYDHAFNEGREAPAAGWYASLERKGDSLWATVRWTQKAQDEIRSEQYRFFSPEFAKNYTSETGEPEGFTILAGALTNRPFLRGMTPVALNQEVEQAITAWTIERVEALAAEESSGVADTPAEMADAKKTPGSGDAPETFKVEIDGAEKELTADEIVALHQKAATADSEKDRADKAEAEAKANKSTSETLSTRVETLEQESKDRDFRELFSQMQGQGRIDAKDETETTWRETFDALGAEKTRALMEQVPAETIPLSAQGRSGSSDQGTAPKGVDADRHAMNQKVEQYMAEHPDADIQTAIREVTRQGAAS
jgi:phage I-like protein